MSYVKMLDGDCETDVSRVDLSQAGPQEADISHVDL